MVYYGHRYYSPSLGRFINKDPIEEQGGLNLYGFCTNNGVNRWDYLGMTEDKLGGRPEVELDGDGGRSNLGFDAYPGQSAPTVENPTNAQRDQMDMVSRLIAAIQNLAAHIQVQNHFAGSSAENGQAAYAVAAAYAENPTAYTYTLTTNQDGAYVAHGNNMFALTPISLGMASRIEAPNSGEAALVAGAVATTGTSAGAGNVSLSTALARAGISAGTSTVGTTLATGTALLGAGAVLIDATTSALTADGTQLGVVPLAGGYLSRERSTTSALNNIQSKVYIRYGPGPESAEQLTASANLTLGTPYPYGVSVWLRNPSLVHRNASVLVANANFTIIPTGTPGHFTVLLPNPVDKATAERFNNVWVSRTPPPAASAPATNP